jgi:hypothetical protein
MAASAPETPEEKRVIPGTEDLGYVASPPDLSNVLAKEIDTFKLENRAAPPTSGVKRKLDGTPITSLSRSVSAPEFTPLARKNALERSLRFFTATLQNSYEYDDAKRLMRTFFVRVPIPGLVRAKSGPSTVGEQTLVYSAPMRKVKMSTFSKVPGATKMVFDADKYLQYISNLLRAEQPGDLAEKVYERLVQTRIFDKRNTDLLDYLHRVSEGLEAASVTYDSKYSDGEPIARDHEAYAAIAEGILVEKDKAVKEEELKKIAEARNFVKAVQAKIMAEMKAPGGGAGTASAGGRRRIYTLRSHRRNVRNQAKRRTRKGLLRQGSRPHRKTRRRS